MVLAILALAQLFCIFSSHSSAQTSGSSKFEFELMHLWLTPLEAPALMVIRDRVLKAGLEWNEHRVKGNFYGVTNALAERVALGLPPTSVFWIGSIKPNSITESTLFRTIPDQATSSNFSQILRPDIEALVHTNEGYTSLPLVIHLQNIALANLDAFAKIGETPPTTWHDFIEMAPRLQAANITPISVSDQRWLLRFLFLSVFAEGLSKSQFEAMLTGRIEKRQFIEHAKRAMKTFRALKKFANHNSREISWSDAVHQVRRGKAALTITGDFAAPGLRDQKQVMCMLAPGNQFVMWSFDVLAFPSPDTKEHAQAQLIGFQALSNEDTLRDFGIKKGGIPVIHNVDPMMLDHCSRQSLKNWQERERMPLTYDHWRIQLNSIASLAQYVWQDDSLHVENVAAQLYQELAILFP
ncbi:MAG TPA: ABC transporter substrate-binding protein [Hyphomicrobiaceae bacterium]|nr:ABC transporter substrate-binding protein [Hyphomicrobiaceae bacterium]